MGKLFAILVISVFTANTCFALGLELSDVIKEAREIQKLKITGNQTKENSIQPVKNEKKTENQKEEK